MGDHVAWALLRRDGEGFLRAWEPSWSPDHFSRKAFRNRVYWAWRAREEGRALALFLIRREDARLIGAITLDNIRRGPSQSAQVGYWIGPEFARQGLMTEALAAVVAARLRRARPQPDRGRLPAGERRLARAARALAASSTRAWRESYLQIDGRWRDHVLYASLRGDRARARAGLTRGPRPGRPRAARAAGRGARPRRRACRRSRATSRSRAAASTARPRRCCGRPRPRRSRRRWRICAAARVGIVPYSGGTGLVGGQIFGEGPLPVILSFERMARDPRPRPRRRGAGRRGRLRARRRAGRGARRRAALSADARLGGLGAHRRACSAPTPAGSTCCATATPATSASGSRR